MRGSNVRPLFFWLGILGLTVLLAGLAVGSATLPPEVAPGPPAVASPSPTTTARPTPSLLSQSRGFVAVAGDSSPATLRRETDTEQVATLRGRAFVGAVSATGRRVAYWVGSAGTRRELRVFDVIAPSQDTLLATVLGSERGAALVWSADRSGLLVVVESSGQDAGADAPGPFSALRALDVPTRTITEIARLTDGSQFWPVGWDRDAQFAGACVTVADGTAIAYVVVGEDALAHRVPMEAGIPARTVQASGSAVLGIVNGAVIRVWSVTSYDAHTELGAAAGDRIALARWKPGGTDIVVSIADRLEVWPAAGGGRRVVATSLTPATDLLLSADGTLAFVTFADGRGAVAVDLATGRTEPVAMSAERLVGAVSFR